MRSIKVTGKGLLKVKPDTMRLLLTTTDTKKDYADALQASANMTGILRGVAAECGFTEEELKTTSFVVDPDYEGYQDKNGNWRQKLKGYRYTHELKLEFPLDNERLGRLLYALSKSGSKAEFRIQYTVADMEASRNELLRLAVEDAKRKATILAEAAGVSLGALNTMDYSFGARDFVAEPMAFRECSKASDGVYGMALDMTPDEIRAEDSVTVLWEIR